MDNKNVADILDTIAQILQLQDENVFKVRAYQNAARTVEGMGTPLSTVVKEGRLGDIQGFGEALQKKVTELIQTGRMTYFEELKSSVPAGLLELLRIPSLGPKKARLLFDSLGVKSVRELELACRENKVAPLKGFGAKSQAKILEGIQQAAAHSGQFRLGDVIPVARSLMQHLEDSKKIQRIDVAGSTRRWKEVVRDLDILCTSDAPEHVMTHFIKANGVASVIASGPTKTSVRMRSGLQVDLRVVSDSQFAPALLYFTGSKEHNVLLRTRAVKIGLSINEYGIFRGDVPLECGTEEELYRHIGLSYVPPEQREATGEIEVASTGAFDLIGASALKGAFHIHSTWSDGTASIEAMAAAARALGWSYMGISDHSKAAVYANGLDESRLRKQMDEIDALNRTFIDFKILKGIEVDILPDGNLDLDEAALAKLDFVIGSVHSRLDMPEDEMTSRVCKALQSKYLSILGHPTGRLLLDREPFKIDLERVMKTAAENRKIVELNANPHRLDLSASHARRLREFGVMTSINPDAHSPAALADVEFGIHTARRAGLRKQDVLNTRTLAQALKILEQN